MLQRFVVMGANSSQRSRNAIAVCLYLLLPLFSRTLFASPDLDELSRTAVALTRAGRYGDAARAFETGAAAAEAAGQTARAARFWLAAGNSRFAAQDYRAARRDLEQAAGRSAAASSAQSGGMAAAALSNLQSVLGEYDDAERSLELALRLLPPDDRYRPAVWTQQAMLAARRGEPGVAQRALYDAIELAGDYGDMASAATAWDTLGVILATAGDGDAAERALTEALRLRATHRLPALPNTLRNFGLLRMVQGRLAEAGQWMDRSLRSAARVANYVPSWVVYFDRARIRLLAGEYRAALADYEAALAGMQDWRGTAIDSASAAAASDVYFWDAVRGLVECSERLGPAGGADAHMRKAWLAVERNRAAGLMLLAAEDGPRRAAQPAIRLQRDGALLSFYLSEPHSLLWTVAGDEFRVVRLPGASVIERAVRGFTLALAEGGDAAAEAAGLERMLFARLSPAVKARPRWALSLDGALFGLPFAALRLPDGRYLGERHTLHLTPSALHLEPRAARLPQAHVLVAGDGIYNRADPRWPALAPALWPAAAGRAEFEELPRLAASRAELNRVAAVWQGRHAVQRLEGAELNAVALRQALGARPALVHIAGHVAPTPQGGRRRLLALTPRGVGGGTFGYDLPEESRIALGLRAAGQEWLRSREVARMAAAGAVVFVNGCASGQAAVLPGAGLQGFASAWMAAGAATVVLTYWPTVDDGEFAARLHAALAAAGEADLPRLVQRVQIEFLHAGGWRARPSYWAAYFAFSREGWSHS